MEMLHIQENPCVLDNAALLCVANASLLISKVWSRDLLGALREFHRSGGKSEQFNFPNLLPETKEVGLPFLMLAFAIKGCGNEVVEHCPVKTTQVDFFNCSNSLVRLV